MVEPEAIQPEVIAEKATQAPQALSTFNFNSNALRVVELEGEPWFVARDVCQALGLKAHNDAYTHVLKSLKASDRRSVKKSDNSTFKLELFTGTTYRLSLISESGLYALTIKARRRNPAIIKFQDWVTQEVLPSIRKTGAYVMGQAPTAETGSTDLMKQQLALLSGVLDKPKSGLILTTFIASVSY